MHIHLKMKYEFEMIRKINIHKVINIDLFILYSLNISIYLFAYIVAKLT